MDFDLDKIIRDNRFTIAFTFPIIGAFMLLGSSEQFLPEFLTYNAFFILFGTLIMRMPLIAGLKPLMNWKAILGIGFLTFYSYLIEYIGVQTGFPYGNFSYGIDLGPMLFDKIPLALPIFFIPLVINAYLLILLLKTEKVKNISYRLPVIISTVLLLDLILDPAAVAINFWNYGDGIYYGVPLSNYLGWILSASVAVITLDLSIDREKLIERLENCKFMLDDMVSFGLLWGLINFYYGNYIPFILSIVLIYGLIKVDRFDFISPEGSFILDRVRKMYRSKI